jgi:sugar phosphate isomerase/epimerase
MSTDISTNKVSRRHFLRGASMLGAASLTGRLHAALAPVKHVGAPRLKIALNAYSFSKLLNDHVKQRGPGMSLLDLVDFCARQNVDAVDVTGYFFSTYPKPPSDAEVNAVKRRAFDCGIDISGTGVRNNFTTADKAMRDASVEHIKEWIEVAARLGAPVLRVFADTQMKAQTWQTVAPGCTRDQVEEWIAGHLRDCAEQAKKFGVIIGVQNHGDFLKTSDDHLSLIKRVDSEWCGAIVDTGYYKSDDPYADMARVAPYAVNWQIKESPFGVESEVRTDLKKLLTIIRMAGYRGYLPIETLSAPGRDYDAFRIVPKFISELREAIDATANIAPLIEPEPARPKETPTTSEPRARKPANKSKTK